MALVVLLRGVNVGGHRTFRPATLAQDLKHLAVVNIGAAGTFVVRRPGSKAQVRAEFARRLPFETDIVICDGRDMARLIATDRFVNEPLQSDTVRFVSVLAEDPRARPALPMAFPSSGPWLLKLLAAEGRFVVGVYRRHMRAIRYLGDVDRLFGVPATTRNWNTIGSIAKVLASSDG